MTDRLQDTDEFPPLSAAAFEIMVSLANGERHGYAIMREAAERTGGHVQLRAGTLYRAVDRMLGSGWIRESPDRPDAANDDARRRYYELTDLGRRVLMAETRRMEQSVAAARRTALFGGS